MVLLYSGKKVSVLTHSFLNTGFFLILKNDVSTHLHRGRLIPCRLLSLPSPPYIAPEYGPTNIPNIREGQSYERHPLDYNSSHPWVEVKI